PLLRRDLGLDRGHVALAGLLVHVGDDVRGEVDDLFKVLRSQVKQVAEPARNTLEVPDVGHRRRELDVPHPLAPHLGPGHLDAAALTDDALEPDPLVLAAVALPVPGGIEDLLAEEPVLLRLEEAQGDGRRLRPLARRPTTDVSGGGEADAKLVQDVDSQPERFPPSYLVSQLLSCSGALVDSGAR